MDTGPGFLVLAEPYADHVDTQGTPYTYEPLAPGEVRILTLHPGSHNECPRVSISHVELTSAPPYEALSYHWGDSQHKRTVLCGESVLTVSPNLFSSFIHLRYPDRERVLWVDAISICQSDIGERNAQVRHMGEIYQRAQQTVIWLGESTASTQPAMSLVSRLSNRQDIVWEKDKWKKWAMRVKDWSIWNWDTRADWQALIDLLRRPWFRRVWIIQEVALSKKATVYCGLISTPWKVFHQGIQYAMREDYLADLQPEEYQHSLMIDKERSDFDLRRMKTDKHPIDRLLRYRLFQASDDRDKVFAIRSLLGEAQNKHQALQPDYNLDVLQVYKRLATDYFSTCDNLDILSVPRLEESSELPTWVPDWRKSDRAMPMLSSRASVGIGEIKQLLSNRSYSSATKHSKYQPVVSDCGTKLRLSGYLLDTIENLGLQMTSSHLEGSGWGTRGVLFSDRVRQRLVDDFLVFSNWHTVIPPLNGIYFNGEPMSFAYWKTLTAGLYFNDTDKDNSSDLAAFKFFNAYYSNYFAAGYLEYSLARSSSLWTGLLVRVSMTVHRFFCRLFERDVFVREVVRTMKTADRKICKTAYGLIGLAPKLARAGDFVALFAGGKVPLVIRPSGDDWELVGDCYVHGIMTGEGWKEEECEELWLV